MAVRVEGIIDLRFRGTLSAGTASAASLAAFSPGSSARAYPAGVAPLHYNQLDYLKYIRWSTEP